MQMVHLALFSNLQSCLIKTIRINLQQPIISTQILSTTNFLALTCIVFVLMISFIVGIKSEICLRIILSHHIILV